MNADTCKDFLSALELYHDRKFTSATRDAYWSELKDYSDENVITALQSSYEKFPSGRVPSTDDIKSLLGEIRKIAQAREKDAELANRWPISRRPRSRRPMVNESFKVLNRLFFPEKDADRLSGRQCVKEMLKMEEKYPGTGWREGAEQLRAWVDKKEEREEGLIDKELKEIGLRALAELEKEKEATT